MSPQTLFDVEPTQGRTRASDPQPSATGAKRTAAQTQRRHIALEFAHGASYVTADHLFQGARYPSAHRDHFVARGTWSSRLGGLVADGVLRKRDEPVQGLHQQVLAYELTDAGRAWVAEVTGVRP